MTHKNPSVRKLAAEHSLTKRQEDVLNEVAQSPHATSEELAPRLGLTTSTFNVHLAKILEKIGLSSKRELYPLLEKVELNALSPRTITLLLVDDDAIFTENFSKAVHKIMPMSVNIVTCPNGLEALMHLSRCKKDDQEFPRPDIIILDLIMPTMDGLTCLKKIKENPEFVAIPTVIFSSQTEKELVSQSYLIGSNSFVLKPDSEQALHHVVRLILQYWGQIGVFPEQSQTKVR
jgi:DNA-binding NarL/FixJ family response regulator